MDTASESQSFIASHSVLYEEPSAGHKTSSPEYDWTRTEELLSNKYLRGSSQQLEEPLRQAILDSFAENLHHWYPFIDLSQVRQRASPLLENTVLMAGSLFRSIKTVDDLQLPYSLYRKSKDMIHSSDGSDPITLLKAISVIACWSLRPPSTISLDGPWHWAGIAMRLALQLGMHQESTYSHLKDPDSCRLIWWYLVVSIHF
jgi:hypothetical protein